MGLQGSLFEEVPAASPFDEGESDAVDMSQPLAARIRPRTSTRSWGRSTSSVPTSCCAA